MFRNKTNVIVFIVVIAVLALACSSVIAFQSIKEAKSENEAAQEKIAELKGAVGSLKASLEETSKDIDDHEKRIKEYREIFNAWAKATPEVSEAMDRIMVAYGVVVEHAHLFPKQKFTELEDEMMDAVYATIRSTDPLSIAKEFETKMSAAQEIRYDVILKGKIEEIKKNGVTFPEDTKGVEELRKYYNGFMKDEAVIKSFVEMGLEKEVLDIEKLLDCDEEKDLALAFEKAVAAIKTPITLKTSLKEANSALNLLKAALEPDDKLSGSTKKASELLSSYEARVELLTKAKQAADAINTKIAGVKIAPDTATKDLIDSLEKEIADWIKKYEIDEANKYLVSDLSATKKAYEKAVAELRILFETYKKAVYTIGKVTTDSKSAIDKAFSAYEAIKNYKDINVVLSLKSPDTVEELHKVLEESLEKYNYLVSLVDSIRKEIDRLHTADPDVTRDEIKALDSRVDELLSQGQALSSLNTDKKDYVTLLRDARLLPDKNEAFAKIKALYDTYYAKANGDRATIIDLVEIKDASLNDVERATTVEKIQKYVVNAEKSFENCFVNK